MKITTATIYDRCDRISEDLDAYLADPRAVRAERSAALACQVLVDGLRVLGPSEELEPRWDAVLFTLEAISRADTVGRPAAHVYRATYRTLANGHPTTAQEG